MEKLAVLLHIEIYPYLANYSHNRDKISKIILSEKYSLFWTGDIKPYMIKYLVSKAVAVTWRNLMTKLKIECHVIIDNINLLFILCRRSAKNAILHKYSASEQIQLCTAILNNKKYTRIDSEIIIHAINILDHDIPQWHLHHVKSVAQYKKSNVADIIADHIAKLILYQRSMRNTWITVCIAI